MPEALVYGANGYTGELIARAARARGLTPFLAGRRQDAVARLAEELGLPARIFPLDSPRDVRRGLDGMGVVLNAAGPFSRTAAPMVEACLYVRAHYLDITGEIDVFEACAARGGAAAAAGVMLLPGTGFDVVPTDCLAAHLHRRLPTATRLALAFLSPGRPSRGTTATMLSKLRQGSAVRRAGVIQRIPMGSLTREVDFGRGPKRVTAIPWGDVSTAYHSTGIPDVEVYMGGFSAPPGLMKVGRWLGGLVAAAPVQRLVLAARGGPKGPTASERATGFALVWGEAGDGERTVVSRLRTPEPYGLTARTAVLCLEKTLAGGAQPGFRTPSLAFGPDLVLEVDGVTRTDE